MADQEYLLQLAQALGGRFTAVLESDVIDTPSRLVGRLVFIPNASQKTEHGTDAWVLPAAVDQRVREGTMSARELTEHLTEYYRYHASGRIAEYPWYTDEEPTREKCSA